MDVDLSLPRQPDEFRLWGGMGVVLLLRDLVQVWVVSGPEFMGIFDNVQYQAKNYVYLDWIPSRAEPVRVGICQAQAFYSSLDNPILMGRS